MKASLIITCLLMIYINPEISSAQSRGGGSTGGKEFIFEETFFPVYVNRNETSSITTAPGVATETGLGYDFRTTFGYAFWGQALIGLTYNTYSLNTKRPYIGGLESLDETTTKTEYGPTIGYVGENWRLLYTHFLTGSKEVRTKNRDNTSETGNTTIKNTEITGFQITLGYTFRMWSDIELGPSLVYRAVSYKKQSKTNALDPTQSYEAVDLYSKHIDASLEPMVTVLVRF